MSDVSPLWGQSGSAAKLFHQRDRHYRCSIEAGAAISRARTTPFELRDCKALGALPLPKAQRCHLRDFQGIHCECNPVLSRFFIEPSTLNHFTPFWRFEKPGYSHLSAARF